MNDDTRNAIVRGYKVGPEGCFVHVVLEDDHASGIVEVPIDVHPGRLTDLKLGATVSVPLGDITKPEIAASISWEF